MNNFFSLYQTQSSYSLIAIGITDALRTERIVLRFAVDFINLLVRFLYADPTPSALQVFLKRPGATDNHNPGLPVEQGQEEGIWINADPMPGCVVCNIGESECLGCVPASVLMVKL